MTVTTNQLGGHMSPTASPQVTIRPERRSDAVALERLAELDSRRLPDGELLLAEEGGVLRAVMDVDGRAFVADPFVPTAHLVAYLATAVQQRRVARHARPRLRLLASSGPTPAPLV
jgi:hypothetical protein